VKKIKRKIVAILACRNNSKRLYGKPLRYLDERKKIRIIDQIIFTLKKLNLLDEIILAVPKTKSDKIYNEVATKHKIKISFGPEKNVIKRLVIAAKEAGATDIFRVTSESPFLYYQQVKNMLSKYKNKKIDAIFFDNIVDGCGFEIFTLNSMIKSLKYSNGDEKEHVTKYIRLNKKKFSILKVSGPKKLFRKDLRLTVDNYEDLVLCKKIYKKFFKDAPFFNLNKIINYLDKNPKLKKLVEKYTSHGYKSMYL